MANLLKYKGLDQNPSVFSEKNTVQILQTKSNRSFSESATEPEFLIPKIEAIHAGSTRNFTVYPAKALKGIESLGTGVYSWVTPYPKPVIFNHDHESDATGRVLKAVYSDSTNAGRPGIILYPKITSPDAIQSIKDKRLLTVSIGGEATSAQCSICHTDILSEGFCGHYKGEEYDGQLCHWIFDGLSFDEVSWVNVPADSDAMVVETEANLYEIHQSSDNYLDHSQDVQAAESVTIEPLAKTTVKEGVETVNEKELLELAKMVKVLMQESELEKADVVKDEAEDEIVEVEVPEESEVKDDETVFEVEDESKQEEKEPEATEVKDEEVVEETEVVAEVEEGSTVVEDLTAQVEELKSVVSELTADLTRATEDQKALYVEFLSQTKEASELTDLSLAELKEAYKEATTEVEVKENTRTHKKVQNPLKESVEQVEVIEEATEQDKIKFISSLLNTKK